VYRDRFNRRTHCPGCVVTETTFAVTWDGNSACDPPGSCECSSLGSDPARCGSGCRKAGTTQHSLQGSFPSCRDARQCSIVAPVTGLAPVLVTDTRRSAVSGRYPKPDSFTQETMAQTGNVAMLGVQRVRAVAFGFYVQVDRICKHFPLLNQPNGSSKRFA
jgi:hypothetical protein